MFILQFNRAVRNKWIWGTFAVLVSVLFAFDCDGRGSRSSDTKNAVGQLDGESITGELLEQIKHEVRGLGLGQSKLTDKEAEDEAWKIISMLEIAKRNGIVATDVEVRNAIQGMFGSRAGAADIRAWLAQTRLSEKAFLAYFEHRVTCNKVESFIAANSFVAPAELQRAQSDYNAEFTVKVADFANKAEKRAATEEELKKYYNDNTNSLALPDLATVRYVAYNLKDKAQYSKIEVSDADAKEAFDAAVALDDARFVNFVTNITVDPVTHETNSVVETKAKEYDDKIKALVVEDLQIKRYPEICEKDISEIVFADETFVAKDSVIDKLAAKDGLKVRTSKKFARDGYDEKKGFYVKTSTFAPGADGLAAEAFALEYDANEVTNDYRYAVLAGKSAIYVIERASLEAAHLATFDEAKSVIKEDAEKQLRTDEFKASIEKLVEKGFDEAALVKAGAVIGTNLTISAQNASTARENGFDILSAVRKLGNGGVTAPIVLNGEKAMVALVVNRKENNDVADNVMLRDSLAMRAASEMLVSWKKWNLARAGHKLQENAVSEEVAE